MNKKHKKTLESIFKKPLNYKGYIGEAVYDDETGNFAGKIANATAVGTFYGETVQDLESEFRQTVDYYLDLCQRKNIEPEKPFSRAHETAF